MIVDAVMACPAAIRGLLFANILVVGGSSKFGGLHERLERELRACVPAEYAVGIHRCTRGTAAAAAAAATIKTEAAAAAAAATAAASSSGGSASPASVADADTGSALFDAPELDASLCAWKGASILASAPEHGLAARLVSRAEYEERGSSICRDRLGRW